MASTRTINTGRGGVSPAVEDGVNLLWTFQLRRENAALLERLEANERVIQARTDESARYFHELKERVDVLESKMTLIVDEEKEARKANEVWEAELRALKTKVESFQGPRIGSTLHHPRRAAIKPMSSQSIVTTPITKIGHATTTGHVENTVEDGSNVSTQHIETRITQPNDHRIATRSAGRRSQTEHVEPVAPVTSRNSLPNDTAVEPSKPRPARSRPSVKQQPTKPRTRRLIQGTGRLATYYAHAATAFSNVTPDNMKEMEFVSTFLSGMRDKEQRNVMVKELQKAHQCRMGKDGTVEIDCEWKHVGNAMRKIGLLPTQLREEGR